MFGIIYDLETSDLLPTGQILNYTFLAINEHFKVLEELIGTVRLSCTQLPTPSAILANKINILTHQAEAEESEAEAAFKIHSFIKKYCDLSSAQVCLAGYNSSKFDLGFLRTTFIRNGLNPYFGGKLTYSDLIFLTKKLFLTAKDFPSFRIKKKKPLDRRVSFSLENVAQRLGLLTGAQTHHSKEDAYLTLELAKFFWDKYDLHLFKFNAFEPYPLLQKYLEEGKDELFLLYRLEPDYKGKVKYKKIPYVFLGLNNKNSSVWVNLNTFEEIDKIGKVSRLKEAVEFFNHNTSCFFAKEFTEEEKKEWVALAARAKEVLQGKVNARASRKNFDIELDIYRLELSTLDLLHQAIWKKNTGALEVLKKRFQAKRRTQNAKDAWVLWQRFQLNNYEWNGKQDAYFKAVFNEYVKYRWLGGMEIPFYTDCCVEEYKKYLHPPYHYLLRQAKKLKKRCKSEREKALLESLIKYYEISPVGKAVKEILVSGEKAAVSGK